MEMRSERKEITEFERVLRNRASIRKYNDRIPDDETIQKIIDAALLSPIVRWHKFHISVVTNKEVIQLAETAANEYAKTKEPKKFMYERASLAVQKANYAVRMYEKVGFRTVDENDEEFIMVCEL